MSELSAEKLEQLAEFLEGKADQVKWEYVESAQDFLAAAVGLRELIGTRKADKPTLPEMNDDLLFILGKPCFQCASIAQILRLTGEDIQPRAESEQAAVIHWMLSYYLKHGENWKAVANTDLKERQDRFKAKEIAP